LVWKGLMKSTLTRSFSSIFSLFATPNVNAHRKPDLLAIRWNNSLCPIFASASILLAISRYCSYPLRCRTACSARFDSIDRMKPVIRSIMINTVRIQGGVAGVSSATEAPAHKVGSAATRPMTGIAQHAQNTPCLKGMTSRIPMATAVPNQPPPTPFIRASSRI
jgi:hypothetical protein